MTQSRTVLGGLGRRRLGLLVDGLGLGLRRHGLLEGAGLVYDVHMSIGQSVERSEGSGKEGSVYI